jgi:hypothetical protein
VSDTGGPSEEAAQDAAWQEIVANFGERAHLDDEDLDEPVVIPEPYFGDDIDQPFEPDPDVYLDDADRFVPPEPGPLPRVSPDRLVAWIGVLGAPVATIVLFVIHATTGLYIPGWAITVLVVAFLAGFGYLVLHMPREPRDPWDDGARL